MPGTRKTLEYKKAGLIGSLVTARSCILENARSLPERCQDEIFLGTWTVKDLLAHLVGWDFTNFHAVQEILAGFYPSFFRLYDKDWQSYNQTLINQFQKETWLELMSEVEASHRQLVSYLQELSPADIVTGKVRNERGRTVTIRNLLISEACDEQNHAGQIAAFRDQQNRKISTSEG